MTATRNRILPQFFSPVDFRFMTEVDPQPDQESVLFVHGMGLLNGGEPDGWTVERFEQLLPYRTPFGSSHSSANDTHVVVTSAGTPNKRWQAGLDLPLPTSELFSTTFSEVMSQFAAKHHLYVVVKTYTTLRTVDPGPHNDMTWIDKRYFGSEDDVENGGVVVMHFFTAELFDFGGVEQYWGQALQAMSLRWGSYYSPFQRHDISQSQPYDKRAVEAFLQQLSEIPEAILGNPDYVTLMNYYSISVVTLIRHHFEEIPAAKSEADAEDDATEDVEPEFQEIITVRAFAVESQDEQGRRHRGGR